MNFSILTNNKFKNMKSLFDEMGNSYDTVFIATAFFSETETIMKLVDANINIVLLVSLRFPTNPYALEKIYYHQNVNVKFLLNDFHSKFYVFLNNNNPVAGIIGSSNFTNGGLEKNIETNVFSRDILFCKGLRNHFNILLDKAHDLEPNDLAEYKKIFDLKNKNSIIPEEKLFNENILKDRGNTNKSITKKAKEYLSFIKIVNEIKRIINDDLVENYPDIPAYFVIDHFWHWLKTEYVTQNPSFDKPNEQKIKSLFHEYTIWEKKDNYTKQMFEKSKNTFCALLSKESIKTITKEQLTEIYTNLHSGEERNSRFHSADKFVTLNQLEKIRSALEYLLYSNHDIVLRIDKLINTESELKLEEFGPSCTQELIGWVFYDKYPMRNDKSDFGVKYLGYKFDIT